MRYIHTTQQQKESIYSKYNPKGETQNTYGQKEGISEIILIIWSLYKILENANKSVMTETRLGIFWEKEVDWGGEVNRL